MILIFKKINTLIKKERILFFIVGGMRACTEKFCLIDNTMDPSCSSAR
jgi:hypothetical protein